MAFPSPDTPERFIDFLWGGYERLRGHHAVASRSHDPAGGFRHDWCASGRYREKAAGIAAIGEHHDVYLAVGLYGDKRRERAAVRALRWLWADLDEHDLAPAVPPATLVVETSPGRTQALWALDRAVDAAAAEERVRAIAVACDLGNAAQNERSCHRGQSSAPDRSR
jgi:hypothetical protein